MDRDESAVTANSRKKVVINLPRSESSFEDFILRCSKEVKQHGGGRGSYLHMALNKEEHALDEDGAKGDAAPSTLKKPRRKVSFLDVGPMNGDETAGAIALVCDQVIKANKVQQPAKPQTWHLPEGPLRNAPPSLAGNDKPTDVNQSTNVQRLQMGPRGCESSIVAARPASTPRPFCEEGTQCHCQVGECTMLPPAPDAHPAADGQSPVSTLHHGATHSRLPSPHSTDVQPCPSRAAAHPSHHGATPATHLEQSRSTAQTVYLRHGPRLTHHELSQLHEHRAKWRQPSRPGNIHYLLTPSTLTCLRNITGTISIPNIAHT